MAFGAAIRCLTVALQFGLGHYSHGLMWAIDTTFFVPHFQSLTTLSQYQCMFPAFEMRCPFGDVRSASLPRKERELSMQRC